MRPFVVAIDGPAGAGKTTVARGVARALRLAHLDTGAMYRALTAKALATGVDSSDDRGLIGLVRTTALCFTPLGITMDGELVGREIRTRRVSRAVSAVSAHRGVRREMVRLQRAILRAGNIVAEGRDIGTVVCPDAAVKVFLTASIDERARRRHLEMTRAGDAVPLQTLKREIARRDVLDSTRAVSPLTPAADATLVDTTGKTPREVIAEIVAIARSARDSTDAARAATAPPAAADTTLKRGR